MELSTQKKSEAKKLGTTPQNLLLADLVAIGYSEQDAYTIAFPENAILDVRKNKSVRESIVSTQKFKRIVEKRMELHKGLTSIDAEGELIDKTQTARLIMNAAMKQPADSKERIEGLMKYSDLMGYRREDTEGDATESINFFFPLKCSQCPLLQAYNEWEKENGEQDIRPVEMRRIIQLAEQQVKKSE